MADSKDPDVPHWTSLYSLEQLESAAGIFQVYLDHPEFRSHARHSEDVARLFRVASCALFPDAEARSTRRARRRNTRRQEDMEALSAAGIRQARKQRLVGSTTVDSQGKEVNATEVDGTDQDIIGTTGRKRERSPSPSKAETKRRKLNRPRPCYVCRTQYFELHGFYDLLCTECGDFNYAKRFTTVDMAGRVCVVTGGRVKIGYCIALRLLRMGASVIVTTRFPHDCVIRFAQETDYHHFSNRLFIISVDFRDITAVRHLAAHITQNFDRLDVLINNAAQTIRRPPKFYEHLLSIESCPLPQRLVDSAQISRIFRSSAVPLISNLPPNSNPQTSESLVPCLAPPITEQFEESPISTSAPLLSWGTPAIADSVALSQAHLIRSDHTDCTSEIFPESQLDRDDQQVDLRSKNSWVLEVGQVSTVEYLECQVINSHAPWVLISDLLPLMERTQLPPNRDMSCEGSTCDKYIINVSAAEGQFNRQKTSRHPHTNMAKAALNMLTRTSAAGLEKKHIYMCSVDTGWVTDERPAPQREKFKWEVPLDEWDGAARVLDPVICGMSDGNGTQFSGVFLKNYKPTEW
ncbi:NAD(P)-binding protein [Gonapodya prolifera JEL478]|uniref:NAD(P)-binding protein n=1 Tax=Gonapodya prolifera (strain JEL478) TaxID=1344416 RepID=A0A139AIC1_GONPJ|nr:NAD(P)-binding protein [Gonapodya prolifera JEL478]|eukprot:KXS16165.1 NAD(P)-binding protein [Gonapodya prolifera JEL478]